MTAEQAIAHTFPKPELRRRTRIARVRSLWRSRAGAGREFPVAAEFRCFEGALRNKHVKGGLGAAPCEFDLGTM